MHKSILILKQIYIAHTNIHSQYEFKPPYNTMQATHLLQHNNPPQNQSQTSHLQEMKNTFNISLNHLITWKCKPPACSNTTYHHKSNFQHHKYRVLQVFKSNKILFIISNQQYSFTFVRNEKHFQY